MFFISFLIIIYASFTRLIQSKIFLDEKFELVGEG